VSIDATILSGLSENNIVLSDTLFNSSVEVVAFTSDTEPDCAPWINKNVAPVILLLLLPVAFAAARGGGSDSQTLSITGFPGGIYTHSQSQPVMSILSRGHSSCRLQ
jgi:hypothetical protein